MKKILFPFILAIIVITLCLGLTVNVHAAVAKSWTVMSPGNMITAEIYLSDTGAVTYSAKLLERDMILESTMGINVTGYQDFTTGLEYVSDNLININETYPMLSGKFSEYVNRARELTISFTKNTRVFNIIVRAYDDGMAFRYDIPGSGSYTGGTNSNTGEATTYQLTSGSTVWTMPYNNTYETVYSEYQLSALNNTNVGMPLLVRTANNDYMMLGAAEVNSTYCGCIFRGVNTTGLLSVRLSPDQSSNVNIALPWKSPWRAAVIGKAELIADTMMFENLSEPNKLAGTDTSWIKPGITSWTWFNGDPTNDGPTYQRYVDLSAEMGWDYVLMDANWQPGTDGGTTNYNAWFEPLVQYARQRGVGLWAWGNHGNLNTESKCRTVFSDWAAKGIVGIKVDYYNNESQSRLEEYDMINRVAAEYHLMVNYHGSNTPSGERRTWPHVIGREGIRGAENRPTNPAWFATLWPFIRNAVGPMDYTPVLLPSWNNNRITIVHNLAYSVLIECGINSFADKPAAYTGSPAKDFLLNIPAAWDESKTLEAVPTSHVVVARRSGGTWYVAGVCDAAKTINLPMSFLGDGTYYMDIYTDGATINDINVQTFVPITKDSIVTLPMKATGGVAIKIRSEIPSGPDSIELNPDFVTVQVGQSANIGVTYFPSDTELRTIAWSSSDTSVATVANGYVTGVKEGSATITATTVNGLTETVEVAVYPTFKLGNLWSITNPTTQTALRNSQKVVNKLETGDIYQANTSAKNIYSIKAPTESDFDISVKLTGNFTANYMQGGLLMFTDLSNYCSVVRRYHTSFSNENFSTIIENAGQCVENNQVAISPISPAIGGTVYLKLEKRGNDFNGYYSRDNVTWVPIYSRTGVTWPSASNLRIGFYSACGSGTSGVGAEVTFEDFRLNGQIIPFTQNVLEYETDPAWTIVRSDPSLVRVKNPTTLTMGGDNGEVYAAGGTTKNIYLTSPQTGNFVVTSKVVFKGTANYHLAALIAYADDDNYFAVARRYHSGMGNNAFNIISEQNGSCDETTRVADSLASTTVYLKIEKVGNVFTGYYSPTGDEGDWTSIGSKTNNNVGDSPNMKVGLFTQKGGTSSAATLDATFENFTVNGTVIPFGPGTYAQDKITGFVKAFITNGDNLTVGNAFDISVFMQSDKAVNTNVYLAEYDADNRLRKVTLASSVEVPENQPFVSIDMSATPTAKGWVKAFIWEDGSFAPLTVATTWKVN